LQRARQRVGAFLKRKCGLVDPVAACRCVRQIPVLASRELIDPARLVYRDHRRRSSGSFAEEWQTLRRLDTEVRALRDLPDYAAPERIVAGVRALLDGSKRAGRSQLFQELD
jgi:hypothetical protein